MKPGNALRTVALLTFTWLAISFQKTYGQVDTTPTNHPAWTVTDLYTGQPVDIYYDTVRYLTMNRATNMPVDYYVINNVDTVQGMTGLIVNNMLIKEPNGKYNLNDQKVRISGDDILIAEPEGRYVYWTPQGGQLQTWSGATTSGEVKQKGNAQKGKRKDQWGTIKWKKGQWKYEPNM